MDHFQVCKFSCLFFFVGAIIINTHSYFEATRFDSAIVQCTVQQFRMRYLYCSMLIQHVYMFSKLMQIVLISILYFIYNATRTRIRSQVATQFTVVFSSFVLFFIRFAFQNDVNKKKINDGVSVDE